MPLKETHAVEQLRKAGCPDEMHARAMALHPLAVAKGLPWATILEIIQKYGPDALAIIEDLLNGLNPPAPKPAA